MKQHKAPLDIEPKYDFEKIDDIVGALKYLRDNAARSGNQDITVIINSAFNLCFVAYFLCVRENALTTASIQ